ncbi:rhodanese-like domain-containing protein [Shinella zoogloeoides]|uniref:rhodanese-like domain-containing protein n=1 Tax=Shinella zoogloeoides TaxID=352475 RepID=UPI00299EDD0D|nr:rhodanese-like domain-containing protein [Shinella zoogloeoides]WPE21047.1 Inner membrane protein YgaP [Shinella zoogloeoides]
MTASVSPKDAALWLASGEAVLVDVREPDEFRAEHIACAASIPLSSLGHTLAGAQIPADRKMIFQCLKGARGEAACRTAEAAGAGHAVYNLEGGIAAWKEAGLPVVGGARSAAIPLFRQVQIAVGILIAALVALGFSGLTAAFALAGVIGIMLVFAGTTGWCGMAMLLARMPWNRQPA